MKFPKVKPTAFIIKSDIYPSRVFVGFYDYELLEKVIKESPYPPTEEHLQDIRDVFMKEPDSYAARIHFLSSGNSVVFFNRPEEHGSDMFGLIAHETLHVTYHILDSLGLGKLSTKTEEAYCYLHGFINSKIYEQI